MSTKGTHCYRGHEFTAENTGQIARKSTGRVERYCITCYRERLADRADERARPERKCATPQPLRKRSDYPSHRERSYQGPVTIDLAEIMSMPAHPDDLAIENAMPWDRHPVPWDNISPLTQRRNRATE